MTKNQRNVLELALINVIVDNVIQGDSWGIVNLTGEMTAEQMFNRIGDDISKLRELSDDQLLDHAGQVANNELEDVEHLEGYELVPRYETYDEFYAYVSKFIDGGDLRNQSTLDIIYWQITKKEN